jgi:hypothetical protein
MLIYLWNTETREYLRNQEAQKNPKRPGEYLMPANATTEQIPDIKDNEVIVWGGEHWEVKPDFRGKYMVNADMIPTQIRDYGELPEGFVLITPEQIQLLLEKGKNYFIIFDGELIKNPNYEKEEEEKEQEHIAMLNMTKYDFYKLICQPNGISYQRLMQLVNSSDDIAAAWNLCERVYRGDETLISAIKMYLPSMTDEELTRIFESAVQDV